MGVVWCKWWNELKCLNFSWWLLCVGNTRQPNLIFCQSLNVDLTNAISGERARKTLWEAGRNGWSARCWNMMSWKASRKIPDCFHLDPWSMKALMWWHWISHFTYFFRYKAAPIPTPFPENQWENNQRRNGHCPGNREISSSSTGAGRAPLFWILVLNESLSA